MVKRFLKLFDKINKIKPADKSKVKFTFDSLTNANKCLSSSLISTNWYTVSIPSKLFFVISIVRLDLSISEEVFLGRC